MELPLEDFIVHSLGVVVYVIIPGDKHVMLPVKAEYLYLYLSFGKSIGKVAMVDFEELDNVTMSVLIRSINFVDFFD